MRHRRADTEMLGGLTCRVNAPSASGQVAVFLPCEEVETFPLVRLWVGSPAPLIRKRLEFVLLVSHACRAAMV
jgi:hypothetical protein